MPADLIPGFELKLATPDCLPNAEQYRADLALACDIAEALPYMNAELEGADYLREAGVLLWKNGGKKYAFRARAICIAPVSDREEAEALAGDVVRAVNGIWERRGAIQPRFEGRKPPPGVLEIYRALPRTNCRVCGYPSCMAFAGAVRIDPSLADRCPQWPGMPG